LTPAQAAWARCKPWIEAAVALNDFYNIEYIEAEIAAGRMEFWPGKYGAVVVEFLEYPEGKCLNVFGGGGELHNALKEFVAVFHPRLCDWANANGCRWITVTGREGWARVGKPLGYKPAWNVIAKELSE
jgi:hypothetical protein